MTAGKSLGWYWNRLRRMNAPELLYRVRQTLAKRVGQWRAHSPSPVPAPKLDRFGQPWCSTWPALDDGARQATLAAADRLLAGRWDVFALRDAPLGFPPRWNVDPQTGIEAPLAYGKRINYRDAERVGNIKYLWEPSRHLEMTTLAQAWRLSGEQRHLDGVRTLLVSWLDQCPYPLGVHWASSLELAIRLLNWSVSWHLIGGASSPLFAGDAGAALQRRWLDAVYRHARFIEGFLSLHSSANNHLLGEYMGLLVAGLTWPCWREAQRWVEAGHAGFGREALRQNAADGVNREQAVYYHHEVADMMLLCGLVGAANGRPFGDAYWLRLEQMLGFIAALRDAKGHVPMIGDADDALMVRFDPRPEFDPYASLLATGAQLFGRNDWPSVDDLKTRWLLGDAPARRTSRAEPTRDFPDGGYWVLGGGACPSQLVCDAGPLGYLSIAAHGHADALAFTLSVQGDELLVDPGTFAYHTEPRWRDYFRSTAAHNTVRIDGQDQSVIGGSFMWLQQARARLVELQRDGRRERWRAEHDGYRRLPDPVTHRREIDLDLADGSLRVEDVLDCRRRHEVELHWHFAEGCEVEPDGQGGLLVLRGGKPRLYLQCSGAPLALSLHRGEENPPLGWISRRFDTRTPICTARYRATIDGPTRLVTRMAVLFPHGVQRDAFAGAHGATGTRAPGVAAGLAAPLMSRRPPS